VLTYVTAFFIFNILLAAGGIGKLYFSIQKQKQLEHGKENTGAGR
jgi:hypothetical protein